MTTGEKLAALRKKKGITQEQLAEILQVSRQSVSRWEMDAAFPETEKLIKLGKLLECSIDFLLNEELEDAGERKRQEEISPESAMRFIRECGYFFLATSAEGRPRLRPMGIIYADARALYLVTDKRKSVYEDLTKNPLVELASYNLYTRQWIRISGRVRAEASREIQEAMLDMYPMIRQEYIHQDEMFFVIFRLDAEAVSIN